MTNNKKQTTKQTVTKGSSKKTIFLYLPESEVIKLEKQENDKGIKRNFLIKETFLKLIKIPIFELKKVKIKASKLTKIGNIRRSLVIQKKEELELFKKVDEVKKELGVSYRELYLIGLAIDKKQK